MLNTLQFIHSNHFEIMVAILDVFRMLYQLFEELQSLNYKLKRIISKSNTGTHFDTKISRFGLAGLPIVVILDLKMPLTRLFEELQGFNWEY